VPLTQLNKTIAMASKGAVGIQASTILIASSGVAPSSPAGTSNNAIPNCCTNEITIMANTTPPNATAVLLNIFITHAPSNNTEISLCDLQPIYW
jgi:hypothetical protein